METIRRYMTEHCIQQRQHGSLYTGKDLFFNRDVMLFVLNPADESVTDAYVQSIRNVSQLSDERFMHVLDIDMNPDRIMAVLKPGTGRLIIDELEWHTFSDMDVIKLVRDLGYGMLAANKEGISGYSVRADNLCLNSEYGLSVINYWEKGDPLWAGGPGLCRLFYQLALRSKEAPKDIELLSEGLQTALERMGAEPSDDMLFRIRRSLNGETSLPHLLSGLDKIVSRHEGQRELFSTAKASQLKIPTASRPSSPTPVPPQKKKRFAWNRKWIIGCTVLIVLLVAEIAVIEMIKKPEPTPELAATEKQEAPPSAEQGPKLPEPPAQPAAAEPVSQDTVSTPALTGFSKEEAEKQALASGLRYQYFLEPNEQMKGTVFKQDPQPDVKVPKGTQITFWVSKGK